jgi:DNA modification methylase
MSDFAIHNVDCLAFLKSLPDGAVDCVVTDPPYCSGGFSETGKRQAPGQGLRSEIIREVGWFVNDNMTTAGLVWLLRSMAVEAARLIRPGGSLCVFTDWRMVSHLAPALESSGLRFQNMIVWDKGNPGLGSGFRPSHEIILHFVKGVGVFHNQSTGKVLRSSRVHHSEKNHQTEKPVDLIESIIAVVSEKGSTVLDPFAGSGTTGVACMNTGRSFIGCEISADYCQIAERRIKAAKYTAEHALFPVREAKEQAESKLFAGVA